MEANPNVGKVVKLTNITESDFTHPYGGHPFTVRAGETIDFPYDIGLHLAKHLARAILIKNDKGDRAWTGKDATANNGLGTPIWNQENEDTMIGKILGETYVMERTAEKSEIDKLKEQIAELNSFRKEMQENSAVKPDSLDRKGLFDKAKSLGIAVVVSDTNDVLRKKIADKEAENRKQ